MVLEAQGFGAGSRELDGIANVVVALVGTLAATEVEQVAWLSTNLDDITGERLAHAMAVLQASSALDVWCQPITMKKGRPGHALNVLAPVERAIELAQQVSELTGTLGVRTQVLNRTVQHRDHLEVEILGQPIRIKRSAVSAKPEFEDVVAAAEATGLSVAEVDALARTAPEHDG